MTDRIGNEQFGCDAEYITGQGVLTPAGADAGRWIDACRHGGNVDWACVAGDLGVHPRVAERLYRVWCEDRDRAAEAAQYELFTVPDLQASRTETWPTPRHAGRRRRDG